MGFEHHAHVQSGVRRGIELLAETPPACGLPVGGDYRPVRTAAQRSRLCSGVCGVHSAEYLHLHTTVLLRQIKANPLCGEHIGLVFQHITPIADGAYAVALVLELLYRFPYRRPGNSQLIRQLLPGDRSAAVLFQHGGYLVFGSHRLTPFPELRSLYIIYYYG